MGQRRMVCMAAGGLLLLTTGPVARAEDVEKKLRLSLSVGGYDNQSKVHSDAANVLVQTDENDIPIPFGRVEDPRNDSAALGRLAIEPTQFASAAFQYAFSRFFLLEGSVGYHQGQVGDVEVQAQFNGVEINPILHFNFAAYRVEAGDLTQVPIQVTALARFRPRATFNPYIGAGAGYIFIGFEPTAGFDELSRRMDESAGGLAQLSPGDILGSPREEGDLEGARVDVRDTFEWHMAGGFEYSFNKKWAAFADLRYVFASRSLRIGFNGTESLGVAVPNDRAGPSDPLVGGTFGPFVLTQGGLVDAGHPEPIEGAPEGTVCPSASSLNCEFVAGPDGIPDKGFYYVQGGEIDYGGISLAVGIRYTF